VLAALFIFSMAKPNTFRVQRSAYIKAPPEKIFALINDFHSWTLWSPYEQMDPALKRNYSGSANGKGAVYEWLGNSKIGQGRMEITDATLPSKVLIKLDFSKPMKAHNISEFTLEPQGDTTMVTWAMYGPSTFMAKIMSIFLSMDKLVGKDFETGLANLKVVAEK
jgi:uncharacterized protein YndB with AHSA1/START domain